MVVDRYDPKDYAGRPASSASSSGWTLPYPANDERGSVMVKTTTCIGQPEKRHPRIERCTIK